MRKLLCILLGLTVIVLQSGCMSKSFSPNHQSNPDSNDNVLTVYLNDFEDIIGPMFEEATGYSIKLVQGSGAEILSRIEAERGNPHWDVVWVDMISSVHGLGLNDFLYEGFVPEHAASLKESYTAMIPEEKWYYPTGAHAAAVIVYNHESLSAGEAPASWDDLANSYYKGAIGFADPTIAAPAYSFLNWFFYVRGLDEARALVEEWFHNELQIYPKNPNVAMALLSGQINVAALQESNAYNLIRQQKPVSIIWPTEGAPAAVRVAAISKETKQLEAAKAFINFLLDPAVQQAIIDKSDEAYHDPSAKDVLPKHDRNPEAKLLFSDALWSYQHEAEIKQWFSDFSIN